MFLDQKYTRKSNKDRSLRRRILLRNKRNGHCHGHKGFLGAILIKSKFHQRDVPDSAQQTAYHEPSPKYFAKAKAFSRHTVSQSNKTSSTGLETAKTACMGIGIFLPDRLADSARRQRNSSTGAKHSIQFQSKLFLQKTGFHFHMSVRPQSIGVFIMNISDTQSRGHLRIDL